MPLISTLTGGSARGLGGLGASVVSVELSPFQSIMTTTVGTAQSTINFTAIPATFTHLQLRGIVRSSAGSGADDIVFRFNSDTSAIYTGHQAYGDGTGKASNVTNGGLNRTSLNPAYISANGAIAAAYGVLVIDIPDYANTNKYKVIRSLNGHDHNGGGYVLLRQGVWMSNTAVSSINLTLDSGGNFMQYSEIALYGIKGA